ncbi:metallo-beta-lactamase superfamily protein [Hydrogenophaga sp. RAC07]|uniref:MBL fold metallo-hydrolase n=1 Tax=Hydrogenophaga sp. RAC07 TaxID=1842537 RepID=UPI00083DEF59|nr:MBL fold metallo-hydrolase [Hydrogenophaga sp. RAC07]AOF87503.1 metallo-beta-lactamase superfamily protein [Hydrogenophaga sp. RAC07]
MNSLCCALGVGLLTLLAGCASTAHKPDCSAANAVPWQAVVPGVWVWQPDAQADVSAANAGHVVPTSVVVSGADALVIDPGPSHRHGLRVRDSLACRFGAQVRQVVNTHAHAENVLANSAFADLLERDGLEILATEGTRSAMQQRCPACLASLGERVGERAMAGTRIVWPSRVLRAGEVVRVGPHRLRVLPPAPGHTESDLVLWDEASRVVWAGGLVYNQRLPELAQGGVDAWLLVLDRIAALQPRHVIGHAVSSSPKDGELPPAMVATRAYLTELRALVLKAMDEGRHAGEGGVITMPAYAAWAGYGERQGFNVQRAWRELEAVWMER